MAFEKIAIRNSISTDLLKVIFGSFCAITVIVTIIQLTIEYYQAKESVFGEIQVTSKTFGPGLAEALWSFNTPLLKSVLKGMNHVAVVAGVKVFDEVGNEVEAFGRIPDDSLAKSDLNQNQTWTIVDQNSGVLAKLYRYQFPLLRHDGDERSTVGFCLIYSNSDTVIDRISYGFFLILVNFVVITFTLWFLFLFFIRRILGKPLGQLTQDVADIRLDDVGRTRIEVKTKNQNELKVLEQAFNYMIENNIKLLKNLKESETEYRSLVDNLNVGIYKRDTRHRFINVNPALIEILGYDTPEQFGRIPFLEHYQNDTDHERFENAILNTGFVKNYEIQLRKKDGTAIWSNINATVQKDDRGRIRWIYGMIEDITRRKEMEKARRARDTAQAANKAKSQFLASMSHEIRTPMNVIIGFTALILRTELAPKQRDYVEKIELSAQTLLGIINDILDFSKIEASKIQLEVIEFNLDEVLSHLTNIVGMQATEKNLEFIFHIEPGLPQTLIGDPLRLSQILVNLCSNAIKFTETGQILVKIEKDLPPADDHANAVAKADAMAEDTIKLKFAVKDTGIGLTPEQAERLFSPFSQADVSTTRDYGGTGLGLTIAKNLVEMMQGQIAVASEPGGEYLYVYRQI